ncbi:MAG: glutathione S-transferase family protein, partial [Stellaceae bacterium]
DIAELTLYFAPNTRARIALWMLEEIGQPFDIQLLSLAKGENQAPSYLAVNPMGKVPALKHGDAIVTEAAAICLYLADRFPQAGLTVPLDDPRRGPFLKWMFFAPSCVEPAILDRMLKREGGPRRQLGWGDLDSVMSVLGAALERGPYLLGERFTAADVVTGAGLGWAMAVKAVPDNPVFGAYVQRVVARPASQRAAAKDAELAKQLSA